MKSIVIEILPAMASILVISLIVAFTINQVKERNEKPESYYIQYIVKGEKNDGYGTISISVKKEATLSQIAKEIKIFNNFPTSTTILFDKILHDNINKL